MFFSRAKFKRTIIAAKLTEVKTRNGYAALEIVLRRVLGQKHDDNGENEVYRNHSALNIYSYTVYTPAII